MAEIVSKKSGSEPSRFFMESEVTKVSKAKVYLQRLTSKENSQVLDGIRGIIVNQINLIKQDNERMSPAQADVLLKLTKTFQMMDTATDKEHEKYDFSQYSTDELKKLAEP